MRSAASCTRTMRKYFGKDDAPVLVWQGTTEEMNSSLVGDPLIAEMYAEDYERASGGIWGAVPVRHRRFHHPGGGRGRHRPWRSGTAAWRGHNLRRLL